MLRRQRQFLMGKRVVVIVAAPHRGLTQNSSYHYNSKSGLVSLLCCVMNGFHDPADSLVELSKEEMRARLQEASEVEMVKTNPADICPPVSWQALYLMVVFCYQGD